MWPLESSKARAERELELERARRACESKRTALVQCERVNARGMCEGLSRDHDFCRASRVKPCHGAAEAFDKCARRAMNWKEATPAPTCESELKAMRRCLRSRWRNVK